MPAVTTFPDVLDLIRIHLAEQLAIPAGDRLPAAWPPTGYLELSRTGGERTRLTEDVQIELSIWHPRSPAAAERIAGEAVSHVVALEGGQLDGWQVLDTGNPGGLAPQPDPRFPDVHRVIALTRLRVRGVSR